MMAPTVGALMDRMKLALPNRERTQAALEELERRMERVSSTRADLAQWQEEESRWLAYLATHKTLPDNMRCPYAAETEKGIPSLDN